MPASCVWPTPPEKPERSTNYVRAMGSDSSSSRFTTTRRRIILACALGAATLATTGSATVEAAPFEPLPAPERIADTRTNGTTTDGVVEGRGPVAAGGTLTVPVAGRAGVSGDATSVVLNVTAVAPAANGFFTVFPCGEVPNASNLNYRAGQNIANTVIATLDDDGNTCVFTSADSNVIIDVSGTMPSDAFLGLPEPRRIADTRGAGETIDGDVQRSGRQAGGTTLTIPVRGRAGVANDAETAVLNLTTTASDDGGFFTVFPCGERPGASNLNYGAGQIIANAVVARISDDGDVCVYTSSTSNIIVDVSGTFATDAYTALDEPQRLVDTRLNGETADGEYVGIGMRNDGETTPIEVTGRAGIPEGASSVILNVTAVRPTDRGFITAHPRGSDRPNASNLNYDVGSNIANAVIARVGGDGIVCLYNAEAADLIIDVAGYLTGPDSGMGGPACPGDEQRVPSNITSDAGFVADVPGDLLPGRYEISNAPTSCSFGRYAVEYFGADTPLLGAFNGAGAGTRLLIDIRPTDVSFGYGSSCSAIRPYQPVTTRATTFGAGHHVVDQHIALGLYQADVSVGCVIAAVESFDGSFGSVLAASNVEAGEEGISVITVGADATGIFSSVECGTWTPVIAKDGPAQRELLTGDDTADAIAELITSL